MGLHLIEFFSNIFLETILKEQILEIKIFPLEFEMV